MQYFFRLSMLEYACKHRCAQYYLSFGKDIRIKKFKPKLPPKCMIYKKEGGKVNKNKQESDAISS